jgi:hypothetical protein
VVAEIRSTPRGFFDTELPLRAEDFPPEVLERIDADPDAAVFEFVVSAVADDPTGIVHRLHLQNETQRQQLEALQRDSARETARADEVTRWAEHLVGELERARAEQSSIETRLPARLSRAVARRVRNLGSPRR